MDCLCGNIVVTQMEKGILKYKSKEVPDLEDEVLECKIEGKRV
jgi:hypothetical protein